MILLLFALFMVFTSAVCGNQELSRKTKLIYLIVESVIFMILLSCIL